MTLYLCIICIKPSQIWLDFLQEFKHYNVYITVDDEEMDLSFFREKYKNINFIQISSSICEKAHFYDVSYNNKKIAGWEKALYYFSHCYENDNHIWFMEDDVFFNNEETLLNIDVQYLNEDLLSNKCYTNDSWYHWQRFHVQEYEHLYHGMMCAVRISKKLLNLIREYAEKYKTLFFLEALLPTLSFHLNHKEPNEFENIYYQFSFETEKMNKTHIYHPLKNLEEHEKIRLFLTEKSHS
jgi:hypothetical protein